MRAIDRGWMRPILVAAGLLIGVLIPVEYWLELQEAQARPVQSLVRLSADSLDADGQPAGAELLRRLRQAVGR